jgi:hypothetical protein
LDRLGVTLRQIEAYNEAVKGDIAVTRRAAYAAEEAMQKLEKEKQHQDLLIDDMQVVMLPPICRCLHTQQEQGAGWWQSGVWCWQYEQRYRSKQ